MMLDDLPSNQRLNAPIEEDIINLGIQMNQNFSSYSEIGASILDNSGTNLVVNALANLSNNSTSSSSSGDHITKHQQQTSNIQNNHHLQESPQQPLAFEQTNISSSNNQRQHLNHEHQETQYYNNSLQGISNYNNNHTGTSTNQVNSTNVKLEIQTPSTSSSLSNMNGDNTQHHSNNVVPSAHCSDLHLQYSLPSNKNLPSSSASNMALNFSHDLLQQSSHQNHTILQHDNDPNNDVKHLSNSFDLNAPAIMQSAAVGMNMWKSSMGLNHFRHPVMSDHNFLPSSEANSFKTWPHAGNLSQQSSTMTHHILDGPHLIGYSQHQRVLPVQGQDLVGASMKAPPNNEQSSTFMLSTISHQSSASQNSSSNHQPTQTLDDLNLRSHSFDQPLSYNLSINDSHFYNSTRAENRSHSGAIKPTALGNDRSMHMALGTHSSQSHYHLPERAELQPTTSHHVAGSSSAGSSKNMGSFRCPTCHEIFSLRNLYQSHLKSHSQEKGAKAKFSCELCGHSFSQKTSLNRHMKSHTGERPFPCDTCGKAFSEKERLKIHMRTHTGEKPFSCSVCGKSFSQKSTVKRHQTVHTGEKKFKCDCGKGFANRGNLIAHIKTRGANHFE